ncbi:patatin-like phospholipase family protein [Brachyspira hyodysenteriae]|uniref:Patatin n=1 Tax=Brachyspira hyodysenteriae ATCC 27164 TaxID=1266923 RepID=A0A3B6VPG1_BRAHO|nr:patatin-like phospholipase family protein [Brachyspira hyodysenteriae]ANN62510.1 patatin [Brachyspira hyodysenteriae ATCC 27164]KLI17602.1 patatin [Brachyspira hyodysenteriae]KLI20515.1 patatin [Brachyspira hyodysenteriae]KLI28830.1 patatin [Brachyspira hyodysenteriae]KLI38552.1 patatin [Brachyspira hyodysenteriae]
MKKLGLVLGGGGGLGSYQIGVWKALREYEIDKMIKAISGTSVGVLNACLIAQNNYDIAEYIWTNEIEDKILSKKKMDINNNYISSNGIFSRKGLIEIIEKYLNIDIIINYEYPIYATAVSLKSIDAEYFKLNNKSAKEIKEIMMATSAIPVIFGRQTIEGVDYIDGGVEILKGNNLPLKPLYEENCDEIIAINLYKESTREKFSNCKVYEIVPSNDIGNFFNGAMDFSLEGAKMRIKEGYNDAKNMLKEIFKMGKTQIENLENNNNLYMSENYNEIKRKKLKKKLNKAIDSLKLNDNN